MSDFIKVYGRMILTATISMLIILLLFTGVYAGVVGVTSGIGKAANDSVSDIGLFAKDSVGEQQTIDMSLKTLPKLNITYKLDDLFDMTSVSESNASFEIIYISHYDGSACNEDECTFNREKITFNKRGFYNILIEIKSGNITNRKVLRVIVTDENGEWE